MTDAMHDLVVVGDGPAARALGAACHRRGVDVVLVGSDQPWTSTYGAWVDEVPEQAPCLAVESAIDVVAVERRRLGRTYGVFHNQRLRMSLDEAPRLIDTVASVRHHAWGASVHTATGSVLRARLVVDAAGHDGAVLDRRRDRLGPSFQTAYGLVLPERPDVGGDAAVLMDWRRPDADVIEPTFLYVIELGEGRWLVEETSLARSTPMAVPELRARLAARLGADLTDRADHVEHVVIPMRTGTPSRLQPTVGFGASAGYVHPATGYSVTASLRAAPRVAQAIASVLDRDLAPAAMARTVWGAVWPAEQRRARMLHDYGLSTLLRFDDAEIAQFFEAFFSLPTEVWSPYLRVDATGSEVSRAMTSVFSRVPWSLRRRLAAGSPATFARRRG
jgi:lycopene beta-cyclase